MIRYRSNIEWRNIVAYSAYQHLRHANDEIANGLDVDFIVLHRLSGDTARLSSYYISLNGQMKRRQRSSVDGNKESA